MKITSQENKIYFAFEITLLAKAVSALLEILGGLLVFFINKAYVLSIVLSFTQEELSEDPKDIFAHYIVQASNDFSSNSQHFIAFYLLSHGIIKLLLIVGLLKKKLWAYPSSIIVFALFIVYQTARFYNTHSIWLLLFTILDIVIIALTIHEYNYMKANNLFKK